MMKKVRILIILSIITMFMCSYNVKAKDTLYSIGKYTDENLRLIKKSYDEKGKQDGLIVAGEYLKGEKRKDDNDGNDYQAYVVKYGLDGKVIWDYSYGDKDSDSVDYLTYSYSQSREVDGYLIGMKKSVFEDGEDTETDGIFVKIGLDGEAVWEKAAHINDYQKITGMVPLYDNENNFDGYIVTATRSTEKVSSIVIRYDKEFNILWQREDRDNEKDIKYLDIIPINREEGVTNYAILVQDDNSYRLIKYDRDGNSEVIVQELDSESCKLASANEGFILYGFTDDVKVNGGKYSYYLINYGVDNQKLWEAFGDIPINNSTDISLLPIEKDEKIKEYLFLYQNASDKSFEVIKLDLAGSFTKKVKKISNEYYSIKNIEVKGDVLYFVGNITCPEEDNCGYDTHSLFLVSDEDKVIEVKDNDGKNIALAAVSIVLLIIIVVLIKKTKNKVRLK